MRAIGFCWHDLLCADPAGAARFYGAVFGWEVAQVGADPGEGAQFLLDGLPFAAAQPLEPESGWPAHWLPVLRGVPTKEAVDRLLSGDTGEDGHLLMEGPGFAVIADLGGAALALTDLPSPLDTQGRGPICATDLLVPDLSAAGFWLRLLGVPARAEDMGGLGAGLAMGRGAPFAGAFASELAPPHRWLPYVEVADLQDRLDAIVRAGGSVLSPPVVLPGGGHAAICADPEGAAFGMVG